MKIKKPARFLIILNSVAFVFYVVFTLSRFSKTVNEWPEGSMSAPDEYINLFNANAKSRISVEKSFIYHHTRNSYTQFTYEGIYDIFVYKISMKKNNNSLMNVLVLNNKMSKENNSNFYQEVRFKDFQILFKTDSIPKMDSIYFSLEGDSSKRLLLTDSLAYFYSRVKSFGVSYFNNQEPDFLETQQSIHGKPMEIVFIRQKNYVYFLVLSPKNGNRNLNGLLYRLLAERS